MRGALTVAVVLAVGAGVWYALKKRAEAPPVTAEAPESALAALPPVSAAGADSGAAAPVEAWRARVVRAARSYSLALDSAAGVIRPVYAARLDSLRRVARVVEAASTTETQPQIAFRVGFLNAAGVVNPLLRDGRESEANQIASALAELRSAAGSTPADIITAAFGRPGAYLARPAVGFRVAT